MWDDVIRTCAQSSTHHQSAAYEALTGYPPSRDAVALTATPADHPNLGSIVARFAPGHSPLPRFVQLPQLASNVGNLTPGQFAGPFAPDTFRYVNRLFRGVL